MKINVEGLRCLRLYLSIFIWAGLFAHQDAMAQSLSKNIAAQMMQKGWRTCKAQLANELRDEWNQKEIRYKGYSLKIKYKLNGVKPTAGRSLYISMHGGGNQAPAFNDQQWENQIKLYSPAEGLYIAPRAPTNTWNLWHESHIDTLFDRLIKAAIVFEDVDPDKVYLMGYSAGGDGVYQLAPRMADQLAAASMMAGHPNETVPLGLRNIGFAIHMGALDSAYNRNTIARHWGVMLDSLQARDLEGYKHVVSLHEGMGHWMKRQDSVAVPWMAKFRRNPLPDRVVWVQDDVHHLSYYWLAIDRAQAVSGAQVVASYSGNHVFIERCDVSKLYIRLNDRMMDLDKPVVVTYLGNEVFRGKIKRRASVITKTLKERRDPGLIFCAELELDRGIVGKLD